MKLFDILTALDRFFETKNPREKVILSLVPPLVGGAIFWYILYPPMNTFYLATLQEKALYDKELARLNLALSHEQKPVDTAPLYERFSYLHKDHETLISLFNSSLLHYTTQGNDPSLYLVDTATLYDVPLTSLVEKKVPPLEDTSLQTQSWEIKGKGTYANITHFLDHLTTSSPHFSLLRFSLEEEKFETILSFTRITHDR